jgi:solute carrier family 9B (sodium/hydrogen exchanger), member 1/2
MTWTKKYVTVPPLVGMIICGLIGRNFHPYMNNYNDDWGKYIRMVCLVVILTRGGMELTFKGKGLTVILLAIFPQLSEALTDTVFSFWIVELPIYLRFTLGFLIGAISPGVVVPSWMHFIERGYGLDKGIPNSLIAASNFDVIFAITIFGVFVNISFR